MAAKEKPPEGGFCITHYPNIKWVYGGSSSWGIDSLAAFQQPDL